MGQIANILDSDESPIEQLKEIDQALKSGKITFDYEDLEAVVEREYIDYIKRICNDLKTQTPQVPLSDEIIPQVIRRYNKSEALELVQALASTIVATGGTVSLTTLNTILSLPMSNKIPIVEMVLNALLKTTNNKEQAFKAVEAFFNFLETHHVDHIAGLKNRVISTYLARFDHQVDDNIQQLAKKMGVVISQEEEDKLYKFKESKEAQKAAQRIPTTTKEAETPAVEKEPVSPRIAPKP